MTTAQNNGLRSNKAPKEADPDSGPRSVWDDPNVPVGNAPPRSTWSLVLFGTAWVGWVVFLIFMVSAARQAAGS